jgi:hypothetical protein
VSHEMWGTYSVRDHCAPRAFVADVMLYDRLVIPFPPDSAERARWAAPENNWNPDLLDRQLSILGAMARPIPWDDYRRELFRGRARAQAAASEQTSPDAFRMTRDVLLQGLPAYVTGVQAVGVYPSLEELSQEVGLEPVTGPQWLAGSMLSAVLAREFLVPDNPRRSDLDLLREAVDLAGDEDFRRKRASFWRWQREFLRDTVTDLESITAAVQDMKDLLADEQARIRRRRITTTVCYAFTLAAIGASMMVAGPLGPVVLGSAGLSVGAFVTQELRARTEQDAPPPVRMFYDARRDLLGLRR